MNRREFIKSLLVDVALCVFYPGAYIKRLDGSEFDGGIYLARDMTKRYPTIADALKDCRAPSGDMIVIL